MRRRSSHLKRIQKECIPTEQNPNGDEAKALDKAKAAYLAQLSANYDNSNTNRVMMIVTLERADGRQIMSESLGAFPDMTHAPAPEPNEEPVEE